ncbi:hypothetical protein HK098_007699 [Nowakowskiella sp. JEL0407]|nr:hypothetical protein HK098_007699 [Nowakowskiella sp. JEL0407]
MDYQFSTQSQRNPRQRGNLGVLELILTPTRDLGVQVVDQLKKVGEGLGKGKGVHACVSAVGGIAIQEQKRLLGTKPDVAVAMSGRMGRYGRERRVVPKIPIGC